MQVPLPSEWYTGSHMLGVYSRHRTEALVSHPGSGHTNIASWGTRLFWPHGGCAPNCVKKMELENCLFFVSIRSYRNLLSQKKKGSMRKQKTPSTSSKKVLECEAKACFCLSGTKQGFVVDHCQLLVHKARTLEA